MNTKSLSSNDINALLPRRPEVSHKYTFGRVVAVCGSEGMCGAAYLCAKAAYRTGCGLVEIVTPEQNRIPLQTLLPEAIVTCYDSAEPDKAVIRATVHRADAVVVGCGLGTSQTAVKVLDTVLRATASPIVIDADALNIMAADASFWDALKVPSIITPHMGEMARLTGMDVDAILNHVPEAARELAAKHGVICLLKHHKTAISDGKNIYINQFGNSGMATGGSGDVLSGIIASLLAQQKRADTLCRTTALGALIHSLAGDRAAEKLGEYSVMASDIIEEISGVLKKS